MYVRPNFKTKKALKEAVKRGDRVVVFEPGVSGNERIVMADVYLEGPHYPAAHTWYAKGRVENGILVKVT